ncbi:hypothetical protein F5X98DRAFT_343587 [Xylaria grammica]|nr:hypothetical protein F5X98DRAFT_343587 [Xylaria grammica]
MPPGLVSRMWAGRSSVIAQQAPSWRFSYVSVLPLIGFMPSHLSAVRYSLFSLLPRIVPGLQPFYKDVSRGFVEVEGTSIETGIVVHSIPNWLDDLLGGTQDIPEFDFQVWRLSTSDIDLPSPNNIAQPSSDPILRRRNAFAPDPPPIIHQAPRLPSNAAFILFFSAVLTYSLIITVGALRDWAGLLSIGLLCTFTSIGSWARLSRARLFPSQRRAPTSPASIVLLTKKRALVIIHTTAYLERLITIEDFEDLMILEPGTQKWVHLISLFPYVFGLALLANATPETKVSFTTIYAIIASLSLLPPTSPQPARLEIHREFIPGCENAAEHKPELRGQEAFPSYMRTMWYAIYATKSTAWVVRSRFPGFILPETRIWLEEASKNMDNINWPARHELDRIERGGDADASATVYGTRHSLEDEEENETGDQERERNDRIAPVPTENW